MFENIPNNNPTPQVEPEDILGGVDKTTPPPPTFNRPAPISRSTMLDGPATTATNPMMPPSRSYKGLITAVIVVIVVVGVGGLAWYAYGQYFSASPTVVPTTVKTTTTDQKSSDKTTNPTTVTTNQATADLDSDSDGIADAKEKTLGTDPYSLDSDLDGLHDKAEIDVYKTDPLKPDTDNDGYKDGEEVKAGYDPNGPGRLFEVPAN